MPDKPMTQAVEGFQMKPCFELFKQADGTLRY